MALSGKELLETGQAIFQTFSPIYKSQMANSERQIRLSAQELLNISDEINREYKPHPIEAVNNAVCVLMPVDPGHLHAYWRLNGKQRQSTRPADLVLKVKYQNDGDISLHNCREIVCHPQDRQQTVSVDVSPQSRQFSIEIGEYQDHNFVIFAKSESVCLPSIREAQNPVNKRPLARRLHHSGSGKG